MAWKSEVLVGPEWSGNAVVFDSEDEALQYGRDLLRRWTAPSDHRAVPTEQPVNYRYVAGELEHIS